MIGELLERLNLRERFGIGEGMTLPQLEHYRRGFILIVMTIFLYQGVGIFYKALTLQLIRPKSGGIATTGAEKAAVLKREDQAFYRLITDRNLFGSTDKTYADKQTQTATPGVQSVSTLVELKGTVAGDSKSAFAVIEEKGKNKQGLYKVGDRIAGATVLKIGRDKILVKFNDKREILKKRDAFEGLVVPGGPGPVAAPSASGTVVLNRADITGSFKDLGSMLSQAQIRPFFSAGVPDGFMVSGIRPGSVYQRMGLTDGDILQGVNGKKMQGADDMMEMYNGLRSASRMSLNVRRQGRTDTLNYIFN